MDNAQKSHMPASYILVYYPLDKNIKLFFYLNNHLIYLNNEYSAHVMAQVIGENTKEICLAHLSQEANTKEMALDTYQRVFDEEHIYFDNIKIADQKEIVSGGHYEN